jgi:(p)ppGpp synthase/HD superfamily hydrolase
MAKPPTASLKTIINTISSYFPEAKFDDLQRAYVFAEEAHRGQLRSSGVSDDALYKRVERLPKRVANGTKEKAKTLADILIDIMEAAS